jgi:Mg/Co/Ni transporter MgtE
MSKTKTKEPKVEATEENAEESKNTLAQAEARKGELVNFVANNILNNITLNQVVQMVQQVAVRDANTIVTEADDDKLNEIEQSLEANKKAAEEAASSAQADADSKA